ncbi:hypothetical protein BW730_01000 [Tessaracoccus aquimaris]|uniref:Uncharacterized protein n=1 Tax=Tessaracoccus aquimaris TaxID=1332264 RepID=A0A1Q2CJR5_9ACTN|nr:hypothetical protein [Tessaracoccus aquimaris]AQP46351.1 hypothetical protein BW730_01000 [Tessaracoccus aquimaris]
MIAIVAAEKSVLDRSVALGCEEAGSAVRADPFDKVDVCLLARLEDAEVGVEGVAAGDQPVGPWCWAADEAGLVPGGPPVAAGWGATDTSQTGVERLVL